MWMITLIVSSSPISFIMLFKSLISASAFLSAVSALETHGGIDFDARFSADGEAITEQIKTFYENTASEQAATRLYKRIAEQEYATQCLGDSPGTDPASFYAIKDCIVAENPNAFFELLAEDIAEADAFWEKVVSESTKPRSEFVAARTWVRAYYDGALTATEFAAWMASPQADSGYLPGNAEHYFKSTENLSATTQRSHIFEGWGGVLSSFGSKLCNFTVPDFAPREFGTDEYPAEWAIDGFGLLQRLGPKTLNSGTIWGVLHIGVRDFTAEEGTTGKSGIEVFGAVYYPPWDLSTEENRAEYALFLKDEDYQIVSEVVNFSLQALEDCASGACVIPGV